MLNIIKIKNNNNKPNIITDKGKPIKIVKYYPPLIQEWKDSIYTFNKNTTKVIPSVNNYIFSIIKSYFNMFSRSMERKIKLPRIRRWKRRRYGRQIWISKPELKHFNDKIIINIYIYNRQYTFLLKKLYKTKSILGKKLKKTLTKKLLKENLTLIINKWTRILKKIEKKSIKFYSILESYTLNSFSKNNSFNNNEKLIYKFNKNTLYFIFNTIYVHLIQKILKYEIIYLRYKQAILLNKFKFKDTYLIPLKHLLQKIYHKKIEFNLISLKRYNLDSSILGQIVITKINNRRNKPFKVIKTSIRKSKVYKFNKYLLKEAHTKFFEKQNYIIGNFIPNIDENHDHLNSVLNNKLSDNKDIENFIFSNTKNKIIAGIKVRVSGRITRRIIAQRAIYKVRYKGTLKNIDSSYKGLSTVILKGYEKSTLQYTQLDYKRKIGSFGFKGWIGTH